MSANKEHKSRVFEIVNPMVILSYGIFFCSILINTWAMRHGMGLKELTMLESLGYFYVPLMSFILLKEAISKRTVFAIVVILIGILVFYL